MKFINIKEKGDNSRYVNVAHIVELKQIQNGMGEVNLSNGSKFVADESFSDLQLRINNIL